MQFVKAFVLVLASVFYESFIALCDFEYSKFLKSFFRPFLNIEQQTKENTV